MQIEAAVRMVHVLEVKLEACERAIESIMRLSRKFEDVHSEGTAKLVMAWNMEKVILKAKIGQLENTIQTTTPFIDRHLTVIK